ncbi:MAG: MFS transporter, partial [Eggerthellaceae bacterium]|nr:MFS transporter [Eggerthellaceae bacterium]
TVGGLFFTLSAIAMIIVRLGSRLFMDRVAPIRILGCGIALNMVSMVLLLIITQQGPSTGEADLASTVLFCLSGFLYGLGVGLSSPINQAVAVKSTPPERWGAANALVLLALDVGVGVASIVWGFVRDMWGFSAVIIGCMALLVVAFLFGLKLYPRGNDDGKRVPTGQQR